jgi:SCY1-like protein 1
MGNQAAAMKKFPYEIGEVYSDTYLWRLHHGKKKATQEPVTILSFEISERTRDKLELARNSFKRLKSIRHPSIIKFLDGVELQTHIYVVTEYIQPLSEVLKSMYVEIGYNESVSWGLYQVIQGLEFLHSRRMSHCAISVQSIFVDVAGDWRIGELGFLSEVAGTQNNVNGDPNYSEQQGHTDLAVRVSSNLCYVIHDLTELLDIHSSFATQV